MNKWDGEERRRIVEETGTLKVWHFIVSQVILFITLLTFIGGFSSWIFSQMKEGFYPNNKGIQLEQSMERLNHNIETQNLILTDLRIFIAKNVANNKN